MFPGFPVEREWCQEERGLNRHAVENERVLQETSSEPPGLESCGGRREAAAEARSHGQCFSDRGLLAMFGVAMVVGRNRGGSPTVVQEARENPRSQTP